MHKHQVALWKKTLHFN